MNTKKTTGFMEHPFLSAGVLLAALFALRFAINFILTLVLPKSMDDNTMLTIMYWTITIIFLVIWVFYRRVRKEYIPTIGPKRGLKTTISVCVPSIVYMLIVFIPKAASEYPHSVHSLITPLPYAIGSPKVCSFSISLSRYV